MLPATYIACSSDLQPPPKKGCRAPCREKLGRAAEALQDFRRAAELEPHNAEARQAVSRLQEPPPPPPLSHAAAEGSCQKGMLKHGGSACAKRKPDAAGGEVSRRNGQAGGGVAAASDEDEMQS